MYPHPTHAVVDPDTASRLKYATGLNCLFVVLELVAGVLSGSLALMSDALHNAVDSVSLILAWLAERLALRPADQLRTYGYHRATVLCALLNSFILVAVVLGIAYEALERFYSPMPVNGAIVTITGVIGVVCNLGVAFTIRKSRKELHVRGAYLHNLLDAFSSLLVVISGALIYLTGAYWIDLVLSLAICIMLGRSILPIVQKSVHILLEGVPENIDPAKIKMAVLGCQEVFDAHDVHVWLQGDGMPAMTCHVVIRPNVSHEQEHAVLDKIRAVLRDEFDITHSTIQAEHESCEQKPGCLWRRCHA